MYRLLLERTTVGAFGLYPLAEKLTFIAAICPCFVGRVSGNASYYRYSTECCSQTGSTREQARLLVVAGQQLLGQVLSDATKSRCEARILMWPAPLTSEGKNKISTSRTS